ncbi:bacterial transcriptional activator domain-containing protein [Chloroflexi bacterium TSY]|nr:bacterial transcriptional activator domain-containing protein [Chloroflexi bacterium TSY]
MSWPSLFWPESGQKTARNALRRELHLLQQSLGDGWLEATREVVACRSDVEIWVDAEKFRQLVEQVKGSAEIDALVEAAELYRGNFLAGFTLSDCPEFDEWQFFEADGLRREYAGVLEILVRHNEEQQKFEPAIDYARRWLALDPMHEPVHRELMRLFALAGQQAAAVRQYDECVRILDEELGGCATRRGDDPAL